MGMYVTMLKRTKKLGKQMDALIAGSGYNYMYSFGESDALKLASSFGGGIGGARETCGAVSAMAMIAGVLAGYDSANDIEEKKKLYALVNGMLEKFREENGSTVCRELLNGIKTSPVPSERTEEYYRTRPCVRFVESAARIVSETLKI